MRHDDLTPPAGMNPQAAMAAWGRNEKPKLDRDRFAIIALLNGVLSLALTGTILFMLPLKSVVPYVVEVEPTGKATVVGAARDGFTPTQAQIVYFISRWTEALWGIDPALTTKSLEASYSMTRGKANEVFRQHVAAYKPIERSASDKSLTSAVQVKSVNFVSDGIAMVRFEVVERRKETKPLVETYMMTLHWIIQPPKTAEDIMQNPIGFFVTDFNWTKEVSFNAEK
ncbi:MAG: hypothetical protein A2286_03960 [Gammaproteobacteria bacterium RIFOXYA12_FULL_61_12]|nr:MAG: hypothetical protein A2514_14535 [Gammaproteobacteria bacterium RIFOXYD12_FULL_61_37]OGT94453.1 MAG: hypothetical protein A2286_03960 [Gammaproteobacteria bacterium RIFOXYA12_FULL_61_12]